MQEHNPSKMSSLASIFKQARALFGKNEFHECIQFIDEEIDEDVDSRILLLRAACLQRLGRYDESIDDLTLAFRADPENPAVYKGLVTSYRKVAQFDKALNAAVDYLYLSIAKNINIQAAVNDWEALLSYLTDWKNVHSQTNRVPFPVAEHALRCRLPPADNSTEKEKIIYEYLYADSKIDVLALKELQKMRLKGLKKRLDMIDSRLKTSISYTEKAANLDKLEAYKQSDCIRLISLLASVTDDNERRRQLESTELELLVGTLRVSPPESRLELQKTIKETVDNMMLFASTSQIAYELYFDYEDFSLDDVDDVKLLESDAEESNESGKKPKGKAWKGKFEEEDLGTVLDKLTIENDKHNSEHEKTEKPHSGKGKGNPQKNSNKNKSKEPERVNEKAVLIQKYVDLFSSTNLAKLISGYKKGGKKSIAFFSSSYKSESLLGYKLCASGLLQAKQYPQLIDSVHRGLAACESRKKLFGMDTASTSLFLNSVLAKCYVTYEAPKNYSIAFDLYTSILQSDPENIDALVGQALILVYNGEFEQSEKLLRHVSESDPQNSYAREELGWVLIKEGKYDEGLDVTRQCLGKHLVPSRHAELLWRIGFALWENGQKEESYTEFIECLKCDSKFAPAFTSLGTFYQKVAKDSQRAQRCFFKAFELSNGEITAGEYLASDLADNGQWDLVEVISKQCIEAAKNRGTLNIDWPFRAMGIISLNKQLYSDAIKCFQQSLRANNNDVQAWIGLGEAYIYTGRYKSAVKALKYAIKQDPNSFSAHFVLSLAQRENGDFTDSANSIKLALELSTSSSSSLKYALIENAIRAASSYCDKALLENALDELSLALKTGREVLEVEKLDVVYAGCAEALIRLESIGCSMETIPESLVADINTIANLVSQAPLANETSPFMDLAQRCALTYVEVAPKDRLATAHYLVARVATLRKDLELAVTQFQAAIEREPNNPQFWNAYGVCIQFSNPEVAQHCFIRSLSLNGLDPQTWVNLAAFYLAVANDHALAEEALNRALSLDAEDSRAWVVQALIANSQGSDCDSIARTLEYAYTLGRGDTVACFALAVNEFNSTRDKVSTLGAMERLLQVEPRNDEAKLLAAALLERHQCYEPAFEILNKLNEPVQTARVLLALKDYEHAIQVVENYEPRTEKEELSKNLTLGLANYFLNDQDSAFNNFADALDCPEDLQDDVRRLLVQVLCASGSSDARETAIDQLFASIEENGATVPVTLLLAAIGYLNDDSSSVMDAAVSELDELDISTLKGKKLANACFLIALLKKDNSIYKRALFQRPMEYELWRGINTDAALDIARELRVDSETMSQALFETGTRENAQRALLLCPTNDAIREKLQL